MNDIYSLSLSDLTPQNLLQDHNISSIIKALDPELQNLSRLSLEPLILARIDELPEPVLDALAWQLHVDFYDLAGTLSMKRQAVKGSILWHMHKGTQWAIHEALRQIDITAEFVPWWQDDSLPYTFKLKAIVSGDFYRTKGRDKLIASIKRAVEESKSARSCLAGLETQINFHDDPKLYAGIVQLLSGNVKYGLRPAEIVSEQKFYTGFVSLKQGHEIFKPYRELKDNSRIYTGIFGIHNRDYNLGVDLETMQELLRQFEKRIFAHIDSSHNQLLELINANHDETNAKLEEIKNMLLWKGDDEDID